MRWISDFVCIDTDETSADLGREAIKIIGAPTFAAAVECGLHDRCRPIQEGPRSTGLHLDHQRLALVHPKARCVTDGLIAPIDRTATLVHSVSGLVQDTHQRGREVGLVVTCRNTTILWNAARERMQGCVEPPGCEIEPDGLGHPSA